MAVPTQFSELSTTAASNPPADTEGISQGDDQFRQVYAFIRSLYEGATNGQIVFPATQNASSNANTLDDYEEGTWTPTDASGASLSFTSPSGNYIKVGKLVFVRGTLTYPTTASGASAVIGGLPFTSASAEPRSSLAIGYRSTSSADGIVVNANATSAKVFAIGGDATNATLSEITIFFSGTYEASA